MGIIKGVLREELQNSIRLEKRYRKALKLYPGGTFIKKKIKGHYYYYLAIREGKKVKFIYKGKELLKGDIEKLKKSRKMRQKYKEFIQKLKRQIKYLRKSLRGKEDV